MQLPSADAFDSGHADDVVAMAIAPPADQDLRAMVGGLDEWLRDHPDRVIRGAFMEAQSASDRQDRRRALSILVALLDRLEEDRAAIGDARAHALFRQRKGACYDRLARNLLEDGRLAEAFALVERRRARTFAATLAGRGPDSSDSRERELLAEALRLDSAIQRMERESPAGVLSSEQERAFQQSIRARAGLAERMKSAAPHLFALHEPGPIALDGLQALAAEDEADVVQYLATDEGVVIWHVGPASTGATAVAVPPDRLHASISALVEGARHGLPLDASLARQLFRVLVQPVRAKLDPSRRLTIIAPHELGALPFQLLQDPQSQAALGETFRLAYLPSAAVMARLPCSGGGGLVRVLTVADSTLSSRADVEIAREVGARVIVLRDPSKDALFAAAAGHDAIHFVAHGSFAAHAPLLTSLRLTPGSEALTAAEMFALPLAGTKLVTLGACEGGTLAARTDEMFGMARALFYAGAHAVVAPLWDVDAESASFYFRAFYRAARSQPADEAARQALVAVKHRFPHPYHWAPFMYFGR